MKPDRLTTAALVSGMTLLCAAVPADAARRRTASDQIADLEHRYSQTFVTGNVLAAEQILADTYIGFGSNGKATNKATMLAEVRSEPHQTSAAITSLTVRFHGDTAIALGTEDDTSPGTQDPAHRMWLDTWKHTSTGWVMVASAEISPGR